MQKTITVIDFETTGVSNVNDKIIQVAIISKNHLGLIEKYKTYVNPGIPIPPEATAIHGITDEMVKNAPKFEDIADTIVDMISGTIILGYNSAEFDIPLLDTELKAAGHDFDISKEQLLDVLALEKAMNPRTLSAIYAKYLGKALDGAHDALIDVEATLAVFEKQSDLLSYPDGTKLSMAQIAGFASPPRPALTNHLGYNEAGDIIFTFGKHNKRLVSDIVKQDFRYCQWILGGDFHESVKNIIRQAMLPPGPIVAFVL